MRELSLKKIFDSLVVAALLLFLGSGLARAQSDELRQSLFREVDAALKQAEAIEAAVYAPSAFAAGIAAYQKADDELRKGGEIKSIQKRIVVATDSFTKSAEQARRSRNFFSSVITARDEAKRSEASQFAAEAWQQAEVKLGEAITWLESTNDASARSKGVEAETAFREAELESIKLQCLGEARAHLQNIEEAGVRKNAPITFDQATRTLKLAEKALEENRRDTDGARYLARQAQEEAQHALYLSQTISRLNAERKTLEEILLAAEAPLQSIAMALGKTVRFHQGTEAATQDILSALQNR